METVHYTLKESTQVINLLLCMHNYGPTINHFFLLLFIEIYT